MRGNHLICHWARTLQLIALSSEEAELNAAVKATQEGLGVAHLEEEFGRWLVVQLYGDSSANHGMIQRQVAGKVKQTPYSPTIVAATVGTWAMSACENTEGH